MRTTKLTLSADKDLIEEAKKLAAKEGTSLSSMVSRFLRAVLTGRQKQQRPGPLTRKATGLVKLPVDKSDRDLLETALADKYER
jgi:hypothetical protein